MRPRFTPHEYACGEYDPSFTYISDDVILFWHSLSAYSQWTPSLFVVDHVKCNCAEVKASVVRRFVDYRMLSSILPSDNCREQKPFGHQVRHFDHALCQNEWEGFVLQGNLVNVSQKEDICVALEIQASAASPKLSFTRIALSA